MGTMGQGKALYIPRSRDAPTGVNNDVVPGGDSDEEGRGLCGPPESLRSYGG